MIILMDYISLNKQKWEIDTNSPLGKEGGFGEVFRGKGDNVDVAIKRLKLTASQAAHREMNISSDLSKRDLKYVVPIIDSGQDSESDRYYLVMPICDCSLQDEINNKETPYEPAEIVEILLEILAGLNEVKDITHRDLKPSNVLKHDGKWKLADFGIAKFVEDSTSLESLRTSLTPPYAAPEQWRLERPTAQTDIYALGCIAHALSTGKPPFEGDNDQIRDAHLTQTPAQLNNLPPKAKSIVTLMLRKPAETRPSVTRCIEALQNALKDTVAGQSDRSALHNAVSSLSIKKAEQEAALKAEAERVKKRQDIFYDAAKDLVRIKERLFDELYDAAKDVISGGKPSTTSPAFVIGSAALEFDVRINPNSGGIRYSDSSLSGGTGGWGVHSKRSKWDIIATAEIIIGQNSPSYGRGANLIFGKPLDGADYRWYEVSFFSISITANNSHEPYHLDRVWEIDQALGIMDINQIAQPIVAIDGENEDDFIRYWIELVSMAMNGGLARPARLPMDR